MQQRFAGKVALVTGSGSGLGAAFARRLASEGARVAVLDLDEAGGAATVASVTGNGGEAIFLRADVTQAESMQQAVAATVKRFGGLDVAVNNAGIGGGIHPLTEFPVDAWTRTIAVNLTGVFLSLRAEIPALLARGGGAIVNIASIVAQVAHPFASAYVASKHGVLGLTRSAALEWGPRNIRINAVGPTWVRTPMTEAVWSTDADWAKHGADHALGRCATQEEIAALVAFLCSDEASIITGSLYLADGGYTAR